VTLRDGSQVLIRPLRGRDRPRVAALFAGLSPETRALRFHSAGVHVTPALLDMVTAGHALVATRSDDVIALASFLAQRDATVAEVAIVVADHEQRHGIGTALMQRLMRDALHAGIHRLRADVVADNRGMLALLKTLAVPLTRRAHSRGEITIDVELAADVVSVARSPC
jgi:L-amino acid N-acyltransferase YncA